MRDFQELHKDLEGDSQNLKPRLEDELVSTDTMHQVDDITSFQGQEKKRNEMKKALITGITGQDGSYLAELLLDKGYSVHAIMRRSSVFTTSRIEHIMGHPNLKIGHGDLSDGSNVHRLLSSIQPDENYNMAAQSHVAVSFEVPEYTADVDALGPLRILDAMSDLKLSTKFYQASTSELFIFQAPTVK